ncbi:MAG: response regulator [Candidatus Alcyoniella australis]|nr:response regulator [Candidatus Alcyoniella australis]
MAPQYAKLLIVDHNAEALNEIFRYLSAKGYDVEVEFSGRKVIDSFRRTPPHVAVISMLTADLNGMDICRTMREDPYYKDVPIILLFDMRRSPKFIREVMDKADAASYLEKPFDMTTLEKAIENLLDDSLIPQEPASLVEIDANGSDKSASAVKKPEPSPPTPRPAARDLPQVIPSIGTTDSANLPQILLAIFQQKIDCVATIETGNNGLWKLEFEQGVPTLILSPFIEEMSTGRLLRDRELIDLDDLDQLRKKALVHERPLGEVLIESGLITPHELHEVLLDQLVRKLAAVLKLNLSSYQIELANVSTTAQIAASEYIVLLLKQVREAYGLEKLEPLLYEHRRLRVINNVEQANVEIKIAINIGSGGRKLLELCNGKRTLGDLMAGSSMGLVDTFKLLYLLLITGMIRLKGIAAGPGKVDFNASYISTRPSIDQPPAAADPVPTPSVEDPPSSQGAALRGTNRQAFQTEVSGSRSGEIVGLNLPRELMRIHHHQPTGRLGVNGRDDTLVLEVHDGKPLKVTSEGAVVPCLGEIMIDQGWIDEQQRDNALIQAADEGRKLGEVLLINGLVKPHQVFEALQIQIEKGMTKLLAITEGNWEFAPVTLEQDPALQFQLTLPQAIADWMLNLAQQRTLAQLISRFRDSRPRLYKEATIPLDSLLRTAAQRSCLRSFNGRSSVAELLSGTPEHDRTISAVILLGITIEALQI